MTRMYKLTDNLTGKVVALIDCTSQAQAYTHQARSLWTASPASGKEVADAILAGVQVSTPQAETKAQEPSKVAGNLSLPVPNAPGNLKIGS